MNTTLGEFYDLSMEKIGDKGRNPVQEAIYETFGAFEILKRLSTIQFTVHLFLYFSGKIQKKDHEIVTNQLKTIAKKRWGKRGTDEKKGSSDITGAYKYYFGEKTKNKDIIEIIEEYKNTHNNAPEKTTLKDAKDFIVGKINDANQKENFIKYVDKLTGNQGTSKGEKMEDQKKVTMVEEIEDYIKELITNGERQIIFTGAPGTGKTRTAKKIAEEMINERKAGEFKIIQFHPSYDYTDFVEGIKPIDSGNGEVVFRKIDGQFKKFCRNCFKDKDGKTEREEKEGLFFFIIDEINRADLSKVFGEIMYCLDKDKRGENGKLDTQYQFLPTYDAEGKKLEDDVYKDGFYIPRNVVILGTMNDIDRSVESMDFALRRRFSFVEFEVTKEMIEAGLIGIFKEEGKMDIDEIAKDIAERLDAVNEVICGNGESLGSNLGLNKQYYLSHGILANLGKEWDKLKDDNENFEKVLKDIFERRIKLTLKEYVRGEDEKEVTDFIKKCEDAFYERKPGTSSASAADHSTDGQDENGEQN